MSAPRTDMVQSDWMGWWDQNQTPWHESDVNPYLARHYEDWTGGKHDLAVFVPLCGKTLDVAWLYHKGHTVLGVELAEEGVREMLDATGLKYSVHNRAGQKVYATDDGRIQIMVGNYFDVSSPVFRKAVGAVWDRGSFEAINMSDREPYVAKMVELFGQNSTPVPYLICADNYDPAQWPGPPHCISKQTVEKHFGASYQVKVLECDKELTEKHKTEWGMDWHETNVFLLTARANTA